MSLDVSATITRLRTLADDTPKSNLALLEVPEGIRDGINTIFRLQNRNIVTASVLLTTGTTIRTASGFTVDLVNGLLTFAPAPVSAETLQPWYVDYNWQWFTDTDYTEFVNEASDVLGIAEGADVALGLIPALLQVALSFFYNRRATQYARRYNSSGGTAGQQVDVVTSNFNKLAKTAWDKGLQMRKDFYERQGQRAAPAAAVRRYKLTQVEPER